MIHFLKSVNLPRFRTIILIGLSTCLLACTPMHVVKPLPNFVEAALEPGDKITLTTSDGKTRKLVVTEIGDGLIVGKHQQVAIEDIVTLKKQAWSRPKSPCGGEKPLGCSVPLLISLTSHDHSHYEEEFYDACAQHDYCYRHGVKTYNVNRQSCDDEFLSNMQAKCPAAGASIISKVIQIMDDSDNSRSTCMTVAKSFYLAVRKFGADKFETAKSTYCEYDGPPKKRAN